MERADVGCEEREYRTNAKVGCEVCGKLLLRLSLEMGRSELA